ncbi:MAG: M23 family metallopeptidase [Saprospiraceae bacterium]|nr:M23 family metallopeptidase [Saprospiraceae bacterium]
MRYFVFILFLWFVGMHSVNAAIPIKETNFISPVRYKVRLAGSFGELRGRHFHAGLDIKSSQGRSGDSIFSAESGYISRIRIQRAGYGKSIYVNHANGYTTVYAHLDGYHPELEEYINKKQIEMQSYEVDILPEQGMFEVVKGQHMAFLGNTGISYGPHLHFEIRETSTDKAINPFLFGITAYDKTPPVITSVRITGLRPDFHKVYDYKIPFTGRKKR